MAVATGTAVASNYYAQPLLPDMGRSLHLSPGTSGLVVTVAQVGYALGLALLTPLGDVVERRRLTTVLCLGTAGALCWLGASPAWWSLLPAALVVGALSVLAQVLVPFAAALATDASRGRVVGTVMSGLLVGILLARTAAGALAGAGGWRTVYFVSAGAMVVLAGVLHRYLPTWHERTGLGYGRSVASVLALLREEPVLRLRSLYGMLSFATFSVLWTAMAFMLSDRYHYSSTVIGLFGLAGAAGALMASVAGRLSDRGLARRTTVATGALLVVSWLALWEGSSAIGWFVVGVVALDVGAQGLHVTNQGEIYRLRPEARSRLTAAYMVIYFAGGAAGSVLSATLYQSLGWDGVCLVGGASAAGTLVVSALSRARPAGASAPAGGRR
jgi:predicted MFS family arabinose efflux permease